MRMAAAGNYIKFTAHHELTMALAPSALLLTL
jgi:hypothetical protein